MQALRANVTKITEAQLERLAYVYVRQSSLYQVHYHTESKRRQYDFAHLATEMGWPRERIVTVDEDQGKSAALPDARSGFSAMVRAVGCGEVGIIMSLEASRLARNSPDWHHLIYMARYTHTLIADETGIYDPESPTDRMILGIRGQMSEMELETSIHRMIEGRLNKAKRGGYLIYPPAGFELDDRHEWIMTPDESVADAFHLMFRKFDELQVARHVCEWWRDEGRLFPVRRYGLRSKPIVWRVPVPRLFYYALHHPAYAGAYVFGRTQNVRELDAGELKIRIRNVKRDPLVLIRDHHEGYISFEKFEQNQAILRGNIQMKIHDREGAGPAREGRALLQGLVFCGHCGRAMQVGYGGGRPGVERHTLQYRCDMLRRSYEGQSCQVVGGQRINDCVVEAFLEVCRGAGDEALALASDQIERENEQAEQSWRLQIERAEYEAKRAERQFDAVEPENRLVARRLEARWNECLREVEAVRAKAQMSLKRVKPLTELELARARRLAEDLEQVWRASTTTNQDRKLLLRAAIGEVQLRSEEDHYEVKIVWKGSATTEREVPRRRRGEGIWHATAQDTVEMIRKLAEQFEDAQIARVLNKQGRRTGEGNPFTAHKVATHRNRHGIPLGPKRTAKDKTEGPFTADEAAAELGVTSVTIHRWLRDGVLPGRQVAPGAPWQIVLTEELRKKLKSGDAPEGWVGLREAARRLGFTKQHVSTLVKSGKLMARRTRVGNRQCWRIDVSSAVYRAQEDLFDRTTTAVSEEA